MTRIAVIDDWQRSAEASADWSALRARVELSFFHAPFADEGTAAARLAGFEVLLVMRERTRFPASLIERLPSLRMIGSTGPRNAAIDVAACTARGVLVCSTPATGSAAGTAELALVLMLAAARRIAWGDARMRAGEFQENVPPGMVLDGRTLGIMGLGRIGLLMGRYGQALGMRILAWSQNLDPERAKEAGATPVTKQALLEAADVVSLHLVLSERTRGVLNADDLARMKRGAILVNTSRGPLVDEAALIAAVTEGRIIAAMDVYEREPLPQDHPFRASANTVLTPHLGYVTADVMAQFYRDSVENALAFLDGRPIRAVNPEVLRPA